MKKYSIIYADPPWEYKSKECLQPKSILDGKLNTHYPTMPTPDIKALNVQSISEINALLFLWIVSPMLLDGLDVMQSWGFDYKTIAFVWYKQRVNSGHYTMSGCELCLVGKTGKIPQPRGNQNIQQFLSQSSQEHSTKPAEVRRRISLMFPTQNKIELFARNKPTKSNNFFKFSETDLDSWDVWGNEVDSDIILKKK